MNPTQVAISARVSSAQQAETHTIASQVTALRERVAVAGLTVSAALQFLDAG
jgi:site-specific DNA recombinase